MPFGRPAVGARESYRDNRHDLVVESREFYFAFINDTEKALVEELRRYFRDNPRTINYRWVAKRFSGGQEETDVANTKIHIASEDPDNPQKFPSVTVSAVSGQFPDLWISQSAGALVMDNPNYSEADKAAAEALGEEYLEPEYLEVGEQLTGKVNTTVTLSVRAVKRPEVNLVSDLVIHGLVGQIRRALYKLAMNWLPNTGNYGPPGKEQLTERGPIWKRDITFGLQTEWYDDFFYQAVNISDVELGTITRDGPLEVP